MNRRTLLTLGAMMIFILALSQWTIFPEGVSWSRLTILYWFPFAVLFISLSPWERAGVRAAGTQTSDSAHPHPNPSPALILTIALLARLIIVFTTTPQLSDDIWRYIHDGRTLLRGHNPYARAPQEVGSISAMRVNHPHLVTIYQPASQWTFAALSAFQRLTRLDGHRAFRLGFIAFDLLIVWLILLHLRDQNLPSWLAVLYAWHPLALTEVAASGHQDVIGIACLLAALWMHNRRRSLAAGVLFALAVAVKPIVLPLALPLAWSIRDDRSRLLRSFAAAIIALLLLYVPFMLMPGGLHRMRETVSTFMSTWSFNAAVHQPAAILLHARRAADVLMGLILLAVLAVVTFRRSDGLRASMIYLFAALLLSSTVHPWYLLWALAFVPMRFHAGVWIWSLTITLSYAVFVHRAAWHLPAWIVAVEYIPVFAATAWSWRRRIA